MTSWVDGKPARQRRWRIVPLGRLCGTIAALLERQRRCGLRIDHLDDRTLADIGLRRPAAPPRRYPDRPL